MPSSPPVVVVLVVVVLVVLAIQVGRLSTPRSLVTFAIKLTPSVELVAVEVVAVEVKSELFRERDGN